MGTDYRIIATRAISFSSYQESGVGAPTNSYRAMSGRWQIITDLLGGTDMMRARGELWLPREAAETPPQYRVRLMRSFLYNGLRDTIEKLVAKPFSRPVTIPVPLENEMLEMIEKNADLNGSDLTQLARECFEQMVSFGKTHILVDYPQTRGNESLAEERTEKIRPYFKVIHPLDLIGWKTEKAANGSERLTQIRIRETRKIPDGVWAEKEEHWIKVYNDDGTWEGWKMEENKDWMKKESGTFTYPGIPLVTIYARKTDMMMCEPPLSDLAELNMCHWISFSDQRNILRFCRFAMVAATGISQAEFDSGVTIGANQVMKSVNPDAKYYFIEHTGAGIEAGGKDLKDLEERMEVLGLQPLVERSNRSTATGKRMDEAKNETTIQTWIRALEEGLRASFEMAAKWIGVELPDKFDIDVFSDFGIASSSATDLTFLLQARIAGQITHETFLKEVKRRGVLSDKVDVELEAANASADAMSFASGSPQDVPEGDKPESPADPVGGPAKPNRPVGRKPPVTSKVPTQ